MLLLATAFRRWNGSKKYVLAGFSRLGKALAMSAHVYSVSKWLKPLQARLKPAQKMKSGARSPHLKVGSNNILKPAEAG